MQKFQLISKVDKMYQLFYWVTYLSLSTQPHQIGGDATSTSATGNTTTKFIATQVLKVSLVSSGGPGQEENSSGVGGSGEAKKNTVTLSVPLSQGLHLSKGQVR